MEISSQSEMTVKEVCDSSRSDIKRIAELVFLVNKRHSIFLGEQQFADQHGEMHANFMLAYRHLEDARMRLGKVLQALNGGVSVYDK